MTAVRITQAVVQRLADDIEQRAGLVTLQGINRNGNSRGTAYCMAESSIAVYYGARQAAAYLLGVLAGSDPDGCVHWITHQPEWIAEVDHAFLFGQVSPACARAYNDGNEYGRTHRQQPA